MVRICFIMLFMALVSGCSTPYMIDRGRDAKDILTASVGVGAGGKVRTGPLQFGLWFNCAEAGLRGGEAVKAAPFEVSESSNMPKALDFLYFAYGVETFSGGPLAPERGKTFHAGTFLFLTAPVPEQLLFGPKSNRKSGGYAKYNPFAYWTEVEAAIGLGGTVRLGVNLGEAVDFLLGWTTLDIFGDDIASKRMGGSPSQIDSEEPAATTSKTPSSDTDQPLADP